MRGLRLTVFVVAFLSLTAELMRHSYVRWVEDHTSVLDKYETVDKEIKDATSLAVLETRYAEALEKEKVEKATQSREGAAQYNPESPVFKLRQAIAGWERAENQIRELRYFWVGGLVCLLLALVCHWRGLDWLSITLQIAAFAEMTWWTTPSFVPMGPEQEGTRLLGNKIVFTALGLLLLLTFWFSGVLKPDAKGDSSP